MKLRFSKKARLQLEEIYNFISIENLIAAAALHNEILDEIEVLLEFPYMAAIEPCLKDSVEVFRALVIQNYKAIYFIEEDIIVIVTIWDCRQDPKLLRKNIRRKSR